MAETIRRGRKRITIGVVALLTLGGASAAFAYWTAGGAGTGEATTGQETAFLVTDDPTSAEGVITPGGPGQTIDFAVTHAGEGTQYLSAVAVTLANADGTPWDPTGDCSPDDYNASVTVTPGQIPANGAINGTATVTMDNTGVNQDSCQGQAVPLFFTAS